MEVWGMWEEINRRIQAINWEEDRSGEHGDSLQTDKRDGGIGVLCTQEEVRGKRANMDEQEEYENDQEEEKDVEDFQEIKTILEVT